MNVIAPATRRSVPAAPARSDLIAKYFRGFGDPTRVRILELLRSEGELSLGRNPPTEAAFRRNRAARARDCDVPPA
jgi:DNA-binding transcriptional ArsR family regulator